MNLEMIMQKITILFLITSVHSKSGHRDNRKELHIGGIFPMTADASGWAGGQACLPAVLMALEDINNRHDVIPGYKLVLHGKDQDSMCQPGYAALLMYQLLTSGPKKLMLLSGCSTETTMVAEAAEMWNLVVMGYGASSPALSSKERFPTFFRTHPSAVIHNAARLFMFQHFNWKRIAVIHSNAEVFQSTADNLAEKLTKSQMELVSRKNFGAGDVAHAVANLKREDARIIIGMYYEKDARKVLCEAYKNDLYGKRYVWFLIGWYKDNWYEQFDENEFIDCTIDQMRKAAANHFTTEGLMQSISPSPGNWTRMNFTQFENRLKEELIRLNRTDSKGMPKADGMQEAPLAYDAIWAIALAFQCAIRKLEEFGKRLEEFNYDDNQTRSILVTCMGNIKFQGVSGQVSFSSVGDRLTLTQIEQLQRVDPNSDSSLKYELIAYYDNDNLKINWQNTKYKFPDDVIPQDHTRVEVKWKVVSVDVYASMSFFAGVGIAMAIACIGFNYGFCYRKLIYLSQYQVNNLMVAGCLVCFVAIFITGLPMERSANQIGFSALCHARVTLLMYGFTLMYGALFSKVWIVHRMGSVDSRDQTVAGWKFYAVVGALASIDTVIALSWVIIDPLRREEDDVPGENKDDTVDVKMDHKVEYCHCEYQHVWIGLVYTYKGLLLLFGLFLAYEIRNAKAKHVNDSRFVSMAIYNVAILCMITGPVTLLIRAQPDANFGFVACTILLCTFISMGLIFVPKVVHVIRVPSSADTHKGSGACSGSITDTALTKEEQDRLKKLMQENEDIQRQIAEKDMRIMELRRRLEFRMAQQQQLAAGNAENSQHKLSVSSVQQLPNGQMNKNLNLPTTSIPSNVESVSVVSKRSISVAPMPQPTTTVTTVHQQKAATISGVAGASVPTEPEHRDMDDSGYRSSTNGRHPSYAIEPADTDVLL